MPIIGSCPPMLPFSPPMRLLSHSVASAFLALVGVSLALAHRDKAEPARLLAATCDRRGRGGAGHLCELCLRPWRSRSGSASSTASPLRAYSPCPWSRRPPAASLAAGAAAIALPSSSTRRGSTRRRLLWLGLGEAEPNTVDWRPLLPWAGRRSHRSRAGATARAPCNGSRRRAAGVRRRRPIGSCVSPGDTVWRSTSSTSRS